VEEVPLVAVRVTLDRRTRIHFVTGVRSAGIDAEELSVECLLMLDDDSGGREFAALADWLRHEEDLRGAVKPRRRAPRPGEMGSPWEVLAVSVGGTGALTVLARSLEAFLRQPRRGSVTVKVVDGDGRKVELSATHVRSVHELEGLLRQSLRSTDHDPVE
jgi:hypothetical protein